MPNIDPPTYAQVINGHRKAIDRGTEGQWGQENVGTLIRYIVHQHTVEQQLRENVRQKAPTVIGVGTVILDKRGKALDFELEADAESAVLATEHGNTQLDRSRVGERLGIRYAVAQIIAVKEQDQ